MFENQGTIEKADYPGIMTLKYLWLSNESFSYQLGLNAACFLPRRLNLSLSHLL